MSSLQVSTSPFSVSCGVKSVLPVRKKVLQDTSLFVSEKQIVVVVVLFSVNLLMQSSLSGFLTGNWMDVIC